MNKSTQQIKYDAEVQVIKAKIGGVDNIRLQLGLSKRKLAQLLMIDPSSLTRWSKEPHRVPAHIYRSLQWYLALIDKEPAWHPQNIYLKGDLQNQILILEKKLEQAIEAQEKTRKYQRKTLLFASYSVLFLSTLGAALFFLF
ncbi:MAG: hypothetical protein HOO06_02075 [Bdellovibrionaceae bacterium]|jgi:hypothetical protein|nr:hypothetical protein [Pseudobdellovibrionaceae bacterium]